MSNDQIFLFYHLDLSGNFREKKSLIYGKLEGNIFHGFNNKKYDLKENDHRYILEVDEVDTIKTYLALKAYIQGNKRKKDACKILLNLSSVKKDGKIDKKEAKALINQVSLCLNPRIELSNLEKIIQKHNSK